MKTKFRLANIFFLVLFTAFDSFAQTRASVEEYKIYSAFINQAYQGYRIEWFAIDGTKPESVAESDKGDRVLIYSQTVRNIHENPPLSQNAKEAPRQIFNDYLRRNIKTFKLTDKFKTKIKHELFPVPTVAESNELTAEAQKRNVLYTTLFWEKHPKALGIVQFSRVGFDSLRKRALFAVAQTDIFNRKTGAGAYRQKLVLLSKEKGEWKIKQIFPKEENIKTLDLSRCQPETVQYDWALGSTSFSLLGIKNGKCHVIDESEIEQGYTRVECLVPTALGEIQVARGELRMIYSKNLQGFCSPPKTGNFLFDSVDKDLIKPNR